MYHVCQKKNARNFGPTKRSADVLIHEIKNTIRIRLIRLKVKETTVVQNVEQIWNV